MKITNRAIHPAIEGSLHSNCLSISEFAVLRIPTVFHADFAENKPESEASHGFTSRTY
jgi:hypothetical protein